MPLPLCPAGGRNHGTMKRIVLQVDALLVAACGEKSLSDSKVKRTLEETVDAAVSSRELADLVGWLRSLRAGSK